MNNPFKTDAYKPVYMGLPAINVLLPRFWGALIFGVPTVILSMGSMIWPDFNNWLSPEISGYLQFGLASVVFFWSGRFFIGRWWKSIRELDPNMFTLTVSGTGAAYVYSLWALLSGRAAHGLYFESTVVITGIVLLGQILEQRAHSKTEGAVRELMELAPAQAHLVESDGKERDVEASCLKVGNLLRVRAGERVPVDGVLVEGLSEIDESMLTGESLPVQKSAGAVLSGGTLNMSGSFLMRAERVGEEMLLSKIIGLVREAEDSEAPIQRVADRVITWFAPCVLLVALATFFMWWWLSGDAASGLTHGMAVLVIACPCALGLATPVSVVTGVGRGAKAGILIKDAAAMELLAETHRILIDKTGTLTLGKPKLMGILTEKGWSEEQVLSFAAAVETGSDHPLARAIVSAAESRGIKLSLTSKDFHSTPGVGIKALFDGKLIEVRRAEPGKLLDKAIALYGETSMTEVLVDGKTAAVLVLDDEIKSDARKQVDALKQLGIELVMVSGDREAAARKVAANLRIDRVHAGVTPDKKLELVRQYRQESAKPLVFAGDGINDAPALASADVGIAMGSGSDVALESAGIVLVGGELGGLVRAIRLSRAVLMNIKQNMFWAFFYNGLGIPVAAGVFVPWFGWSLSPMLAGVAMCLSSICVVGNALRLRGIRIE